MSEFKKNIFGGGVYTVLITPFDDYDNIILDDISNNICIQIKNGIDGIILLGTTSESPTISLDEKKKNS